MKKLLSMVLAALMLLSVASVAFAYDGDVNFTTGDPLVLSADGRVFTYTNAVEEGLIKPGTKVYYATDAISD